MTIHLSSELAAALQGAASRLGVSTQSLVEQTLRERFGQAQGDVAAGLPLLTPRDEWERKLLAIGRPCGVALSNEVLSSEGLYD